MTDGPGQAALLAAVEAVALDGRGGFRWLGRAAPRLLPGARGWLDDEGIRAHLVNQLTQCLYANLYVRGEPMPWREQTVPESRAARTSFVVELSRANAGTGTWFAGRLVRIEGDLLVVRYAGLEVYARPEECGLAPGARPEPGQVIRLRLGPESLRSSPGYFFARGDRDIEAARTIRWYWHLEPRVAADFVAGATRALRDGGIPYHLKVLADPLLYARCDAGVIYVARPDATRVAERLLPTWTAIRDGLRPETPMFTRRVAPGVALADDPGAGDSFGLDRCRLVAEGLARAAEAGAETADERLAVVNERFVEAGLDPHRPHLGPGLDDVDVGTFEAAGARPARRGVGRRATASRAEGGTSRTPRVRPGGDADPLGGAARIGERIEREAIWYRDRCQWVGAETTFGAGGSPRVVYRSLAPTVYGGTAGIALFLGELSHSTGDRAPGRTALGAIRQALSALAAEGAGSGAPAGTMVMRTGSGLYSGSTGVALVAVRLGRLLGDEDVEQRGRRLAERGFRRRSGRDGHDLLYGSAGRILGLLALEEAGVAGAAEVAAGIGVRLIAAAEASDEGLSWPAEDIPRRHNLTGLSHGAAGIALALGELGRRTRDDRFSMAARRAIEYENAWFDPAQGNWPDFRLRPGWRAVRADAAPTRFSTYWCHGAPGIALQRARALDALGEPALVEDVRRAAATTGASMTSWLRGRDESFSLCHGLLGNAEVLTEVAKALGDPDLPALADEAAAEGLRRHGEAGDWPCGTLVGDTPSLLLGRAGIGYYYLRRHDPTVPSVLDFDPAQWGVSARSASGT